jgi:glucose-6-phosphate 1-dehydrogenase
MPGETTTIVIFGASGDLTSRKRLPALFNLWLRDRLSQDGRAWLTGHEAHTKGEGRT